MKLKMKILRMDIQFYLKKKNCRFRETSVRKSICLHENFCLFLILTHFLPFDQTFAEILSVYNQFCTDWVT